MNTIIGGLLKWANTVSSIPNCPKFVEPYGALCHGQDRSLGMVFPTAGSSTALSFFRIPVVGRQQRQEQENPSEQGRKSARLLNTSLCSLNRLLRKLQVCAGCAGGLLEG